MNARYANAAETSVPHSQTWARTNAKPSRISCTIDAAERAPSLPSVAHRADRHRRDEERGRVERERRPGADARDQPAADGRPGQSECDRAHELVERVRLGEVGFGKQVRHDRVERRVEERRRRSVDRAQRHDVPQREPAAQRQQREQPDSRAANQVGSHHHASPVDTIADGTADEQEHDRRDAHRDSDERQRGRRVRQHVDLPGHRDEERAVADERQRHPGPESPEVAVPQRGEQLRASGAAGPVERLVTMLHRARRRAVLRDRRLRAIPASRRRPSGAR